MHWKVKSKIYNSISKLPSCISYRAVYLIQRHFGSLRFTNPVSGLQAGVETWKLIKEQGIPALEKVFLEIGTGRVPLIPLAFWLMGARMTTTIDLNPYLKEKLIKESLDFISNNREVIESVFEDLLDKNRFEELLRFNRTQVFSKVAFLDLCSINYIPLCDAANTGFRNKSVDFITSHNVLEHIESEQISEILEEGNRIISNDGLFVNRVDYSDHFSHSDKSISPINFLQYTDTEWKKYAGNKYSYNNRLRHDDFIDIFQKKNHLILETKTNLYEPSIDLLSSGTSSVNERFSEKSREIIMTLNAWIITKKSS